MALYRTISISFWTDSKVVDDFTPEDRYFYLYLFTNPHTSLSGCYEISLKQVSLETGYTEEAIKSCLTRFECVHNVIRYSVETKEVLLLNWHKYNWTASEKYRKPLLENIKSIKNREFRDYLMSIFEGEEPRCIDTVSDEGRYPIDTSNTVTNTNTVSNTKSKKSNTSKSKDLEEVFEAAWKMYPEKKGKGRVSDEDKRKIAEIGLEHFSRAVNRYKSEVEASSYKQYQNGSTFFHSGYIDYLDENYEPSKERKKGSYRGYKNNDDTNMDELEKILVGTN